MKRPTGAARIPGTAIHAGPFAYNLEDGSWYRYLRATGRRQGIVGDSGMPDPLLRALDHAEHCRVVFAEACSLVADGMWGCTHHNAAYDVAATSYAAQRLLRPLCPTSPDSSTSAPTTSTSSKAGRSTHSPTKRKTRS